MSDPVAAGGDSLNTSQCLLPPSYFSVPTPRTSSQDPLWTRSAMQGELDRLRDELADLRGRRGASPHPETAALFNETLTQQANELARCRSEWERERSELTREVSEWRSQADVARREATDIEEAATKRLAAMRADFEHRLREQEMLAREVATEFEKERASWHRQANEDEKAMTERLTDTRASLMAAISEREQLDMELKAASTALESSKREVERLRAFESWSVDRAEVMDRCDRLQERLGASEEAAELKEQRLEALQAILTLQETELARHEPGEEVESLRGLVSRWREKVFALMVQAEASAQAAAAERRQFEADRTEAARQLERSRGHLAQTELKLRASQAELAEERARTQHLNSHLRTAQAEAKEATFERNTLRGALSSLRTAIEEVAGGVAAQERELASRVLGPLAALERRLEAFAQRLPVLKAQMKRLRAREALEQARAEFESRESEWHRELSVVRADRDRLARQMEQDAEERSHREQMSRCQYEEEIATLEQRTEALGLELSIKAHSLERSEQERVELAARCESLAVEQERLEAALSAAEKAGEEAASAATAQLFAEHVQQMTDLRATLDEARREHTKAVLSLRQTERDLERCRAEHAGELAEAREASQYRMEQLEAELGRTAAEANLLRATVRQEGLLRARTNPKPVTFAEEPVEASQGQGSPHKAPTQFQPHLVNLIEEVRTLVRSVETSELYCSDEEEEY